MTGLSHLLAGFILLVSLLGCARDPKDLSAAPLEAALAKQVSAWLDQGAWVRSDGYGYAVDLGQLLIYAARGRERPLYLRLREVLLRDYLIEHPCDVTTRGMVAWRRQAGKLPDASGTTEALRVAQGLWEGGRAFGEVQDLRLALRILRGYLVHQCSQGEGSKELWFIRNYFNLGTRTFATNSFLIDHDADLLYEVGEAAGSRELLLAAARTDALIRKATTPAGLLYEVVQPELATLMDAKLVLFSPNDEVRLANAATVAEHAVRGASAVGRQILRFAMARRDSLRSYYLGRTGEALGGPAERVAYAALLRLAIRLHDAQASQALLADLLAETRSFLASPEGPRLYAASELLLALQASRSDLVPLPPPPSLGAVEEIADLGTPVDESGLSATGLELYRLFLKIQPPQSQDGQRCSDPAVAELAGLVADALAPELRTTGWSKQPALRQAVRQKLERHFRAVKVERERLQPITEQVMALLSRLDTETAAR